MKQIISIFHFTIQNAGKTQTSIFYENKINKRQNEISQILTKQNILYHLVQCQFQSEKKNNRDENFDL